MRPGAWPRAAVFDCDGLLIDSSACWERAYAAMASELGRSPDDIDLTLLTGASVASAAAELSRQLAIQVDAARLRALLIHSFAADQPDALPGVRRIVNVLAGRIPLAVATNGPLDVVGSVLERLKLADAFATVVSAEHTERHKPAPDVYLEACRRLEVAPCDAVAFEDSALGARAARAAGLFVIAVPSVPRQSIDADLTVSRLDEPALASYLRLSDRVAV